MHKRNLFSWFIYDAGNSFLTTAVGSLFLTQWLILDKGVAEIWHSSIFSLATILVLLTSPFFGAWSDSMGRRLPFLRWFTIALVFSLGLLAFIAPSNYPVKFRIIFALILFVIIQYFYQLSLIFYNSLLEKVSSEKTRGRIAGLGEVFGNLGWISSAIILLQFTTGKIVLIGESGRAQAFLPALIIFTIFSLPMLFLFKESGAVFNKIKFDFKGVWRKTVGGLRNLIKKDKNVAIFLVAFCLICDAILTIQLYFAILMDRLYKISDTQKVLILILMYIFVCLSAYFWGRIGDKYGFKKILFISCVDIVVIFSMALLSSGLWALYLLAFFAGLGWGGFLTASRALMIKISPTEHLGEYFGFYSTFQRLASIIGPLMWGAIILLLNSYKVFRYQVAGFSLIFLMIIGIFILKFVKENNARLASGK